MILLESRKKFPNRTHTLELCRHIISEMTPLFCDAVKSGKMKADAVQREKGGGMEDLLHSLLVHNDDGISTGVGLSDQAYGLGKKVRQSDEWLALAKAVEKAQLGVQHNNVTQPLRADEYRAQNSEDATQAGGQTADRREMVDAYIAGVLAKTGQKISRRDIWLVAGYENATEFERFQRNDRRTTQSAITNFHRVLGMIPDEFIRLLKTRKASIDAQANRSE